MNLARTSTPRRAPVKDSAGHTLANLKTLARRSTERGVGYARCQTCRAPILYGVDADRCGWLRHVDWTPLDVTGELLAVMAGRSTFTLQRQPGGNPKLTRRHARHIKGRQPLGAHDVVPEHRCGARLPTIGSQLDVKAHVRRRNEPPPF